MFIWILSYFTCCYINKLSKEEYTKIREARLRILPFSHIHKN